MKKLILLAITIILVSIGTSCTRTQGIILGGPIDLSLEEQEESALWEGDVYASIRLKNGDIVVAAINKDTLNARILRHDLNVDVIVDGKNNDFYFIQ